MFLTVTGLIMNRIMLMGGNTAVKWPRRVCTGMTTCVMYQNIMSARYQEVGHVSIPHPGLRTQAYSPIAGINNLTSAIKVAFH